MELNEKTLIELFDYNWKIEHTTQPHLFHYTGIHALKSILENNELWVSKSDFLNDYSEINYIRDVFSQVYKHVKSKFNDEISGFFDLVNNGLTDYFGRRMNGNEYSSMFILSLSENQDSLVLWSNYSNVDGYNICFDVDKLIDVFINQRSNHLIYDTFYFGKIIYDEVSQIQILFDEIMRIYSLFKEKGEFTLDRINEATALCQVAIETYSMFFKKKGFEQENEYRIAFVITDREKIQKNVKYRVANGSLIPYLTIPFHEPKCPIEGVTIGPKNNTDTSMIGLRHFLDYKGFSHIRNNIFKSTIPLRF